MADTALTAAGATKLVKRAREAGISEGTIIDTLDAVAQDRVLRGQIASKVQNGEMTLKQGNAALQALAGRGEEGEG